MLYDLNAAHWCSDSKTPKTDLSLHSAKLSFPSLYIEVGREFSIFVATMFPLQKWRNFLILRIILQGNLENALLN